MHNVFAMLQQLQQEHGSLKNVMKELQVAHGLIDVSIFKAKSIPQAYKKPQVSLLEKFERNSTKLQDFLTSTTDLIHTYQTKLCKLAKKV